MSCSHLKRQTDEAWPDKAQEGCWGQQKRCGDPGLPPNKRTRTKDTRQSGGPRLLPMMTEGRREAGAGGRTAIPSLCCVSACSVSKPKLQTWAWPHSLPLPPTISSLMQSVCWHPWFNLPTLPTSLSGMAKPERPTELPVKEVATVQALPFIVQGPGLSLSTPPLCHSSSPARPDRSLRDQKRGLSSLPC